MPKLNSISRHYVVPLSLGVLCLVLAIWLCLSDDPQAKSLWKHFSLNSASSEDSQNKITRSKTRKKTKLSEQPHRNALENYLSATNQGLTRNQVASIVNEIKGAFPEGDYPKPNTIETIRKVRNQQIQVYVHAVAAGLTLSSQQQNNLKQELQTRADHEFSEFSAMMRKPITSDGKQYQIVSAGKLRELFTPLTWLKGTDLHEVIDLNELQASILSPANTEQRSEDNQQPQNPNTTSEVTENSKAINHVPLIAEGPFYSGLTINPLPLTPKQGAVIFTLEKRSSDKNTEPNYLLEQSLLLSRAQLTLALLLRPKNATTLQKALSEN